jgi:hypothetical protein
MRKWEVDWFVSHCKCWHCFVPKFARTPGVGFSFQLFYLQVAVVRAGKKISCDHS